MAHLSDQELKDLKARVISAMRTGAGLARANDHLLALIAEVEEHRGGAKKGGLVLKVGEMDVKRAEPAPVVEPDPPAEDEDLDSGEAEDDEEDKSEEKTEDSDSSEKKTEKKSKKKSAKKKSS